MNLADLCEQPAYLFGGLKTTDGLLRYLRSRRSDIALVSYSLDETGLEDPVVPAIFHNADKSMPLASTMKIVVLAAYAREVAADRLDPDERVPVGDWQRYFLRGTDGGAHVRALSELGFSGEAEPDSVVSLDLLAWSMIRHSDNAATDYLLDRLGDTALEAMVEQAGLAGQEPIRSLLGEYLSFANHEHPLLTTDRLQALLDLSAEEYGRQIEKFARSYLKTPWGEAEREARRRCQTPLLMLRNERCAVHHLTPRGTARDYARIMAEVVSGRFVSAEVSEVMRRHLEWPMGVGDNRERFRNFGAKGGTLAGILTEAIYLTPDLAELESRPRVVVLFMQLIPFSAWIRMLATFVHQEFMVRLATDRGFAEEVEQTLG